MRAGLPRHPSLEPCSRVFPYGESWSHPKESNAQQKESFQLGASQPPRLGKPPRPHEAPLFMKGPTWKQTAT